MDKEQSIAFAKKYLEDLLSFFGLNTEVHVSCDDEVIERANRTGGGLAATVWTADLTRGHRIAEQMDTEIAWLNSWFDHPRSSSQQIRMQGPRQVTWRQALDIYTETTNIVAAKHN